MKRELLDQFEGKQNVTHVIGDNGAESFLSQSRSFADETNNLGATILDIYEKKPVLLLFNNDEKVVGKYYMSKKLQGQTPSQIVEQKENLYFFESWYFEKRCWVPCVGVTPKNRNPQVILKDGYYSVVDEAGNIIVPPGKYVYIDFFDTHGLARVKIGGGVYFAHPEVSIKEKWGIINTKGEEVLPVEYSEIWKFYGKDRRTTKVIRGGEDENGYYEKYMCECEFNLVTLELKDIGYYDKGKPAYLIRYDRDNSDQYDVMDALDGEPEAWGNLDWD